jgi:hypothetical protein
VYECKTAGRGYGSAEGKGNFKIPLELNRRDSKQFMVPNETVISRFRSKISHTSQ